MQISLRNQSQMRERSEAAIGDEQIALTHLGMHVGRVGHVVVRSGEAMMRCRKPLSASNKREDVSDGEPAAFLLGARLTEGGLQLGPIAHRKAGAVQVPGSMSGPESVPATAAATEQVKALGDAIEKPHEERQRQRARASQYDAAENCLPVRCGRWVHAVLP